METLQKTQKKGIDSSLRKVYPRIKLVVGKAATDGFEEVRCEKCRSLLYRMRGALHKSELTEIEVKCRRCGEVHRR